MFDFHKISRLDICFIKFSQLLSRWLVYGKIWFGIVFQIFYVFSDHLPCDWFQNIRRILKYFLINCFVTDFEIFVQQQKLSPTMWLVQGFCPLVLQTQQEGQAHRACDSKLFNLSSISICFMKPSLCLFICHCLFAKIWLAWWSQAPPPFHPPAWYPPP